MCASRIIRSQCMCWVFTYDLDTHVRGSLNKEFPPPDWCGGMSGEHFLVDERRCPELCKNISRSSHKEQASNQHACMASSSFHVLNVCLDFVWWKANLQVKWTLSSLSYFCLWYLSTTTESKLEHVTLNLGNAISPWLSVSLKIGFCATT